MSAVGLADLGTLSISRGQVAASCSGSFQCSLWVPWFLPRGGQPPCPGVLGLSVLWGRSKVRPLLQLSLTVLGLDFPEKTPTNKLNDRGEEGVNSLETEVQSSLPQRTEVQVAGHSLLLPVVKMAVTAGVPDPSVWLKPPSSPCLQTGASETLVSKVSRACTVRTPASETGPRRNTNVT